MTGAASPRGCCRVTANAGSPGRRESAQTDNRSQPRTRSRRSARTGSSGRRWSERSAAKSCPAPISSTWSDVLHSPASDPIHSAIIRSSETSAPDPRRIAMIPRPIRGLMFLALALVFVIPPAIAGRGGRGGGGGGFRGGGGGGMPRGGGGGGGG